VKSIEALKRLKKLWKILHIDVISLKDLDIDVVPVNDLDNIPVDVSESEPQTTVSADKSEPEENFKSGDKECDKTENTKQDQGKEKFL
jgi:hypothetical protein